MEFFKANTKIDFMGQRKWAAIFSIILFIFSVASLSIRGLNLGLDFTGGTQIEVTYQSPVTVNTIRDSLAKSGFTQAIVQPYTVRDISIRVGPQKISQDQLKTKLAAALPGAKIVSLSYIGPQVSKTLMTNGILAIIVSLIGTMIYIALRFEYRFAVSSTIALIHDPVLILGIFAFFQLEFDLVVLAALLTVIGYSLNDTIVVYDRIRENFRKMRKGTPVEVVNVSINQTLSRTIMTSGLTLLVVVVLYFFGGPVLHNFSLALIIGIIIGTYSSIYVAGSSALTLGLNRQSLLPNTKAVDDLP